MILTDAKQFDNSKKSNLFKTKNSRDYDDKDEDSERSDFFNPMSSSRFPEGYLHEDNPQYSLELDQYSKKPSTIYVDRSFSSASSNSHHIDEVWSPSSMIKTKNSSNVARSSKSYAQLVSKDQSSLDIIKTNERIDELMELVKKQTKHQVTKSSKNRTNRNPNFASKSNKSMRDVPKTSPHNKSVAKTRKASRSSIPSLEGKLVWSTHQFPMEEPRIDFDNYLQGKTLQFHLIGFNCTDQLDGYERDFWKSYIPYILTELNDLALHVNLKQESKDYVRKKINFRLLSTNVNFDREKYDNNLLGYNRLLDCLYDFIHSIQHGITVWKIPKGMYKKATFNLWHSKFFEKNDRIKFIEEMQLKRLKYILIDHVVYENIDLPTRKSWLKYAIRFLVDIKSYTKHRTDKNPDVDFYPSKEEIADFLVNSNFPYEEYQSFSKLNIVNHLEILFIV